VVERAPEFRGGGQNVDVRGVGREVLARMGVEDAAIDRSTREEGTAWIDERGEIAAQFLTSELEGDGPTAELEILRGDLAQLLYDTSAERARYRFGDWIEAVVQQDAGVEVHFASGASGRYDLVVVAEGVGSSTRELVFAGENDPRWLNVTLAYFTIPRVPDDDLLWRWYHTTGGRGISLRPDRHGTTRAMLSVHKEPKGEQEWSVERKKAWLREQFHDAGWQAKRVLAGMETTDDFYFDVLRQVRLPRWSKDRIVLLGDAAWCVTPLGGVGATLALTGGYVLASELARTDDVAQAASAYETQMRPMVEDVQGIPKIVPRMANPHSRLGLKLLHGVLKIASLPAFRDAASKLFARPLKEPDLSRYDATAVSQSELESTRA
jgi:2-polyprenyl-6-methoxyphenol hydroxylase-like FAD-dependent oxidoreductase